MKKGEFLYLEENILHAVRIEQPNADGKAVRLRTNKLLGYEEKELGISVIVTYTTLARLEKHGLLRSELRTVKTDKGNEVERHYFHTTDKGKKKDSEYKPADSDVNTGTSKIPIFVQEKI